MPRELCRCGKFEAFYTRAKLKRNLHQRILVQSCVISYFVCAFCTTVKFSYFSKLDKHVSSEILVSTCAVNFKLWIYSYNTKCMCSSNTCRTSVSYIRAFVSQLKWWNFRIFLCAGKLWKQDFRLTTKNQQFSVFFQKGEKKKCPWFFQILKTLDFGFC